MNIVTKSTNYSLSSDTGEFINEKLGAIGKLLGNDADSALLEVEVGKVTVKHQNGPVYRAEGNLSSKGKLYRAVATAETMETAVENMRNELTKELTRARGKERGLMRRGGSAVKSFLRWG